MKGGRLSGPALAYIAGASIVAIAVAVIRWHSEIDGNVVLFGVIAGLGMLAHAYPVQGFRHQAYQVTLPFIVIAAATFSTPELVAFIVLIHLAEQVRLRRRLYIQWFNVCDYYLSAAAAAAVYQRAAQLLPDDAFGYLAGLCLRPPQPCAVGRRALVRPRPFAACLRALPVRVAGC